ncbi:copper resistance protein NlpE N-terminal domain-containing protein [Runella aurantiaca]|uniref:Copper resistance protein NlpE n=1 Tax=Runella aurantiaca TaxID=2282308 RepID=A0A369I9N5_9BACT|nr:copper resistance protein NlpE N-terminal domain-containing protein [Runella aurantiaca]RDB04975.1 hypothetical protein DVG78_15510 [Runella aurantiaca]
MKKLLFFFLLGIASAEVGAQNVPSSITSTRVFATGAGVMGIFEGRCPCQELATLLKASVSAECFKTKWSLTLLQDPQTRQPTTYELDGSFYRANRRKGSWSIVQGTKNDPNTVVYQLESDNPDETVYLMKGDENVLFFLDKNKNLLVGNELFSYTLNRVERKIKTD